MSRSAESRAKQGRNSGGRQDQGQVVHQIEYRIPRDVPIRCKCGRDCESTIQSAHAVYLQAQGDWVASCDKPKGCGAWTVFCYEATP